MILKGGGAGAFHVVCDFNLFCGIVFGDSGIIAAD